MTPNTLGFVSFVILCVVATFVFLRLITAPYFLWKGAQQKIAALEGQKPLPPIHEDPDAIVVRDAVRSARQWVGTINAMAERAGDYAPIVADDYNEMFWPRLKSLKESADAVWADPEIRQARRDFLNIVSWLAMGKQKMKPEDAVKNRKELVEATDKLIGLLRSFKG